MTASKFTLAIESAIGGGSLSLRLGGREVENVVGGDRVSRAEDLLPNIIEMLRKRSAEVDSIGLIAVALGPGSFTGIRVGIATALGLKKALHIPCVGVSTLKAMAFSNSNGGILTAAVPIGRDQIGYQTFDHGKGRIPIALGEPRAAFTIEADSAWLGHIVAHPSICGAVRTANPESTVIEVSPDLANAIGEAAENNAAERSLEPVFLSPAR